MCCLALVVAHTASSRRQEQPRLTHNWLTPIERNMKQQALCMAKCQPGRQWQPGGCEEPLS